MGLACLNIRLRLCDDVFAETADVVVGDAWIPKYLNQGNSLLVTRSNLVDALIKKYTQKGELITDRITIDEVDCFTQMLVYAC